MAIDGQAPCPLPKRASVHGRLDADSAVSAHARAHGPKRTPSGRSALRWSGAAATTGMLAAVFAPAAGATTASDPAGDPGKVAGKFGVEESWANSQEEVLDTDANLRRDPAAASRARYRVPVEIRPCVAGADVAANGSRQITTQSVVYMPLREGTFAGTSYYGYRIHPILGYSKLHEGDDYSAAAGTPIYSVADGVVKTAAWGGGRGFYTVIEHTMKDGSKFESWYLHQTESGSVVTEGQQVKAGQQIGQVGSTGLSTGAHLHLEIHDASGASLPPSQWLQERGAVFLGEGC